MLTDFEELIHRQVESDTLDYKAHQSWNAMNAAARGKFIRHLAAFANTGGGFLVVGVGEDESGCPCVYTGLTEEESRSFDPSSVGAYINRCVEPPIDFSLEKPIVRGKRYVVFAVRPFKTLPHVCTRSIENELQTGVFYIRTRDASSRPACRALEMHQLVQAALRNQRELLAKMLRGILYETRAVAETPEDIRRSETEAANDVFASSIAYFRRRRTPHPGEPGVLLECAATVSGAPEFTMERLREAALRAAGQGGFISSEEARRANPGNVALRYLCPKAPRMFQLFRRGWILHLEFFPTRDSEISVSEVAERLAAFCFFIRDYYRELGLEKSPLELAMEASGLTGTTMRSEDGVYPARTARTGYAATASASDISDDVAGHAMRLLQAFGGGFGLPETVSTDEIKRIFLRFQESPDEH